MAHIAYFKYGLSTYILTSLREWLIKRADWLFIHGAVAEIGRRSFFIASPLKQPPAPVVFSSGKSFAPS
jgi:hypothetical protein